MRSRVRKNLDSHPGPHFGFHSPFSSNLNVKLEPFSTLLFSDGAWNIACDKSP